MRNVISLNVVRAMANTLIDHDVNPYDEADSIMELIRAGWSAKEIRPCLSAACLMACIRLRNDGKKKTA